MMEPGEIKQVKKKGLSFEIKATREEYLVYDEEKKTHQRRQIGVVISEMPPNIYGIEKGTNMLIDESTNPK